MVTHDAQARMRGTHVRVGFRHVQGVQLNRGLHQLGASTNQRKEFKFVFLSD